MRQRSSNLPDRIRPKRGHRAFPSQPSVLRQCQPTEIPRSAPVCGHAKQARDGCFRRLQERQCHAAAVGLEATNFTAIAVIEIGDERLSGPGNLMDLLKSQSSGLRVSRLLKFRHRECSFLPEMLQNVLCRLLLRCPLYRLRHCQSR